MTDKQCAVVTGGAGFIGSHMVDLLLDPTSAHWRPTAPRGWSAILAPLVFPS